MVDMGRFLVGRGAKYPCEGKIDETFKANLGSIARMINNNACTCLKADAGIVVSDKLMTRHMTSSTTRYDFTYRTM